MASLRSRLAAIDFSERERATKSKRSPQKPAPSASVRTASNISWDSCPIMKLPESLWIKIILDHGLTYFDVKRLGRVGTMFRMISKSTSLDNLMFRGGEVEHSPTEDDEDWRLHPLLLHGKYNFRDGNFTISPRKSLNFHFYDGGVPIIGLESSQEFAVVPPQARIELKNVGSGGVVENKTGVTVHDVVEKLELLLSGYTIDFESGFNHGYKDFTPKWPGWLPLRVGAGQCLVLCAAGKRIGINDNKQVLAQGSRFSRFGFDPIFLAESEDDLLEQSAAELKKCDYEQEEFLKSYDSYQFKLDKHREW
ncbi:hypothetical protein T439DRAFT_366438 [Meredithblackwellia eburnea MCA 4105]